MDLSKNVLLVFFFIFLSCKDNKSKNTNKEKITKEIKNKKKLNSEKVVSPFNNSDDIYERILNESAVNFINRVYNSSIDLNHPIIETDNWIKDINVIFVFINKELEEDLGTNVEGYVYISTNKIKYRKFIIDTCEPAGRGAIIETVFFC